jgi:hypothetical protein
MPVATSEMPDPGQGDVRVSPIAAPNAMKTRLSAAAPIAPANTGAQSTDETRGAIELVVSVVIAPSPQANEGKNRHDDDDQTDQVNDAVHVFLLFRFRACRLATVRNLDGEGLPTASEAAGAGQDGGSDEDHEHRTDQDAENSATVRHWSHLSN